MKNTLVLLCSLVFVVDPDKIGLKMLKYDKVERTHPHMDMFKFIVL